MRRKKGYQPMGVEAFIEACPTCKNQGSELCGECLKETNSGYEPEEERGITNADRIRAMTDDELALFLAEKYANASVLQLQNGGHEPTATEIKVLTNMLRETWMRWLREPYKENNA